MRRLDASILALVERAAHAFQRRTGSNAFLLAKLADMVMAFGAVRMYRLAPINESLALSVMVAVGLFILGLWFRDAFLDRYYSQEVRAAHPMHQRLRAMWGWRLGSLAFVPWCLISTHRLPAAAGPMLRAVALMSAGLAVGYYLRSVVPLPPGAVRQRRAVRRSVVVRDPA